MGAALGMLVLAGTWWLLYRAPGREELPGALPAQAWPAGFVALQRFPAQGPNECGAYSLALALHGLTGVEPDRSALVAELVDVYRFSEALTGTRPWTLVSAVRRRQLGGQAFSAADAPLPRRLDLIKRHLADGRVVLLLLQSERGVQHYVLALGYTPERIAVYDPAVERAGGLTRDLNGPSAGNRSLQNAELLEAWSRGGALGLFRWWYLPVGAGGTTAVR